MLLTAPRTSVYDVRSRFVHRKEGKAQEVSLKHTPASGPVKHHVDGAKGHRLYFCLC